MSNPLSIFERARAPHRKKKPFIHKAKPKEEKLITVSDVSSKLEETPDFDRLDKLLGPNKHTKPEKAEVVGSSLPGLLAAGKIDEAPSEVLEKYAAHELPIPRSKAVLKQKALKHLDIIPKLLSGDEELSIYYTLAHAQKQKSSNATMSSQERWDIPWTQFIAGFYGLKRQSFVSMLIQQKYAALLKKSRNKTIVFWSSDMFCTYVLANEIILRIVMEDMKLSKLAAEAKLQETADFGCHLADQIDLEDDLEFDEFEVLAGQPQEASETGPSKALDAGSNLS